MCRQAVPAVSGTPTFFSTPANLNPFNSHCSGFIQFTAQKVVLNV